MKIGFTGTQAGMTTEQRYRVLQALNRSVSEFHHGDCIGSDEQAHKICRIKYPHIKIHLHPPQNPRKRANCEGAFKVWPSLPYLERNRQIVRAVDVMLATPMEYAEHLRSGTWATIRYARRLHRRLIVIYPDGSGNWEN